MQLAANAIDIDRTLSAVCHKVSTITLIPGWHNKIYRLNVLTLTDWLSLKVIGVL